MPYKLRKAPNRDLYWVITSETKKKHSKEPISLEKAKAQLRILESALVGGGYWTDKATSDLTKIFNESKNRNPAILKSSLASVKRELKHAPKTGRTTTGLNLTGNKEKEKIIKNAERQLRRQTRTPLPVPRFSPDDGEETYNPISRVPKVPPFNPEYGHPVARVVPRPVGQVPPFSPDYENFSGEPVVVSANYGMGMSGGAGRQKQLETAFRNALKIYGLPAHRRAEIRQAYALVKNKLKELGSSGSQLGRLVGRPYNPQLAAEKDRILRLGIEAFREITSPPMHRVQNRGIVPTINPIQNVQQEEDPVEIVNNYDITTDNPIAGLGRRKMIGGVNAELRKIVQQYRDLLKTRAGKRIVKDVMANKVTQRSLELFEMLNFRVTKIIRSSELIMPEVPGIDDTNYLIQILESPDYPNSKLVIYTVIIPAKRGEPEDYEFGHIIVLNKQPGSDEYEFYNSTGEEFRDLPFQVWYVINDKIAKAGRKMQHQFDSPICTRHALCRIHFPGTNEEYDKKIRGLVKKKNEYAIPDSTDDIVWEETQSDRKFANLARTLQESPDGVKLEEGDYYEYELQPEPPEGTREAIAAMYGHGRKIKPLKMLRFR